MHNYFLFLNAVAIRKQLHFGMKAVTEWLHNYSIFNISVAVFHIERTDVLWFLFHQKAKTDKIPFIKMKT